MIVKTVRTISPHPDLVALQAEKARRDAAIVAGEAPAPESPSVMTKLRRLKGELSTWARNGAQLVPRDVRRQRLVICQACRYYDPVGNLGLGQCRYPGCGCTRGKLWLATSVCPHKPPKWPAWRPPAP